MVKRFLSLMLVISLFFVIQGCTYQALHLSGFKGVANLSSVSVPTLPPNIY